MILFFSPEKFQSISNYMLSSNEEVVKNVRDNYRSTVETFTTETYLEYFQRMSRDGIYVTETFVQVGFIL